MVINRQAPLSLHGSIIIRFRTFFFLCFFVSSFYTHWTCFLLPLCSSLGLWRPSGRCSPWCSSPSTPPTWPPSWSPGRSGISSLDWMMLRWQRDASAEKYCAKFHEYFSSPTLKVWNQRWSSELCHGPTRITPWGNTSLTCISTWSSTTSRTLWTVSTL